MGLLSIQSFPSLQMFAGSQMVPHTTVLYAQFLTTTAEKFPIGDCAYQEILSDLQYTRKHKIYL